MNNATLNKKYIFLLDYVNIANIHVNRLNIAILKTAHLFPIDPKTLSCLDEQNLAFMDMLTTRFSKLQDIIGAKIFPLILELLGETDALSFIDKIHRLEKLKIINNSNWWIELRECRNQMAHDYPDNYELLAANFNKIIPMIKELIISWDKLTQYIVEKFKNFNLS